MGGFGAKSYPRPRAREQTILGLRYIPLSKHDQNIQCMYMKLLSGCNHGLDCPFDIRLSVCVCLIVAPNLSQMHHPCFMVSLKKRGLFYNASCYIMSRQ